MTIPDAAPDFPEPPPLHTDDQVRAIGAPALKADRPEGDIAEHWFTVWSRILAMLHLCGAPVALYAAGSQRMKDRRLALNYLRVLEAMIRRILLIMAAADTRPLKVRPPRTTSGAAKARAKSVAGRSEYRGMLPSSLPIRFVLTPPLMAPYAAKKRVRKARRALTPICFLEPLPPELDTPQTRRRHRLLLADHRRAMKARKSWPVYAIVARFEALIRVYKDPLPYVMRIRQRIAAEQGRHANEICVRMLKEPLGLSRGMRECVSDIFWQTCAAVRILRGCGPPIVAA